MSHVELEDLIEVAYHMDNAMLSLKEVNHNINKEDIKLTITSDQKTVIMLDRELSNITANRNENRTPDSVVVNILGFQFEVKQES